MIYIRIYYIPPAVGSFETSQLTQQTTEPSKEKEKEKGKGKKRGKGGKEKMKKLIDLSCSRRVRSDSKFFAVRVRADSWTRDPSFKFPTSREPGKSPVRICTSRRTPTLPARCSPPKRRERKREKERERERERERESERARARARERERGREREGEKARERKSTERKQERKREKERKRKG